MSSNNLTSLFEDIVDVGERLCTAISERELDAIHDCLEERSELLVQLEKIDENETIEDHPRWETINEQLGKQHERIQQAFANYRDDIEDELQQLNGYREAQSAYEAPDDGSRQILNNKVRG